MRAPAALAVSLIAAACGQIPTAPDAAPPPVDAAVPPSAQCRAQRALFLVGGSGGFAWFTLLWPTPAVITSFQTGYAYDDPANAKNLTVEAAHPLFVRRLGARGLWEGRGKAPQPSVFVAGVNETHTQQPSSILISGTLGIAAAGAVLQSDLAAKLPVIAFAPGGPYGAAPGAPPVANATSVDSAVALFRGLVGADVERELPPTQAQLARYVPPGATNAESLFGSRLAFTANAFRQGVVGTVIIQAFADDPHGAFDGGTAPQRAANLAAMLDEFYSDLAATSERSCGDAGGFLSMADNVVTIAVGDTPKNPFASSGWGDGTPGSSNWMYLRSNGFTRPGWFGAILPGTRTNFNPTTGATDANATVAESTAAAFAGALYAISRGDKTKVRLLTTAPFDGVILR